MNCAVPKTILEAGTLNCEICEKKTNSRLCPTCNDYIGWIYPDEESERILDLYNELSEVHFYLKSKRRKSRK